jgi:hypothetical protein
MGVAHTPEEFVMAVRFVALLIPLAITLPQLRANVDAVAAPPAQVVPVAQTTAVAPAPSALQTPRDSACDTRRMADETFTHAALEPPLQNAVDTAVTQSAVIAPLAAPKAATLHKRMSPKPKTSQNTALSAAKRAAQRALPQAGCSPLGHCAPVVQAKVTPVMRKAL